MILVRTPKDDLFNYTECREAYEQHEVFEDAFSWIIDNSYFYSFYDIQSGDLIGCIFFYDVMGKLFINGFAGRKHHNKNLECLRTSLDWFDEDVYAEPENKQAKLCLLRCGFKKLEDNLYIYRRNKNA